MKENTEKMENLAVSAIRATCIDMINKAKSGHPGMALGSAPILYTLFTNHLCSDPTHPDWINRDRFILSAGHASALLYTMLHLFGYGLTIDDLKNFRQLDSLTPGHPEYRHTLGVDATAGPLGQGIAQAVGVAMAEKALQSQYPDGDKIMDHYTYSLCGDGCLEEGLSQEAISLAGHLKLNKLILFYDSNRVTLDGDLSLSSSENAKYRFLASGWDVITVKDGNDISKINDAINSAKKSKEMPTVIIVETIIGYGSSKEGTSKVHGSPLGEEDGLHAKHDVYHYDYPPFEIPQEVYDLFNKKFISRGKDEYARYQEKLRWYKKHHEAEYERFIALEQNDVNDYLPKEVPHYEEGTSDSTRSASGKSLNDLMNKVPNLVGGSADVAGSVMTKLNNGTNFSFGNYAGHNINFGIREFAMACAQNGMLLHGGLRTYAGCFLVFADYMKAAIRIAALSKLPAIYLFSHDSIAVGEDGPTHQPIEQLAMLRSIPNVNVLRPCDERETYASWLIALASTLTPHALILSRQSLPLLSGSSYDGVKKGGYVISKETSKLKFTIIATGSEVSLAVKAQELLEKESIGVRVVSMPCVEIFASQSEEYRNSVLGVDYDHRIACEMLSTFGWYKYAKTVMGIDTFGTSAPAKDAITKFDFTAERLVNIIKELK